MISWRIIIRPIFVVFFCGQAALAQEFTLVLPENAQTMLSQSDPMSLHGLPIGPYAGDAIPVKNIQAPRTQTAYKIAGTGRPSTLDLMGELRAQITQAGFSPLYECDTRVCGGFDFRYNLDLLPEPEMHVDLGDFRYLLAQRGNDFISLMVSRSTNSGFVQVTKMGDFAVPPAKVTAATKTPSSNLSDSQTAISAALSAGTAVVLEDLVFASGQSDLTLGDYASLKAVSDWLAANPDKRVMVYGYTDASGNQNANLTLSQSRANTVREWLIATLGVAAMRISATGLGAANPRADNNTPEGRMLNRRVEILAVTPN